jgi:CDP-diacylglycerol--serine O-phosphatidyltransferase
MKHLPNLLTLANLFCGCIAIAYILTAQPYYYVNTASGIPVYDWVFGAEQVYLGCIFIFLAAGFDFLDGFAARGLKSFSPLGKDLDSLADMVSFGVAPSMIMYRFLGNSLMSEKNAFDVSMLAMAPAFLQACFAALRLAKYNITASEQKNVFIGMPSPAAGLFVASLPIIVWYNPYNIAVMFQKTWVLYLITAILCGLMVSTIPFFKLMPGRWNMAHLWPRLLLVAVTAIAIPFLGVAAILVAFILYIILSIVYRQPEVAAKPE